ncbi:nitrate ABC transporter ATP-binding protein [Campylobacter sp. MIT 12-8780]|uniref:ABC transporter ATP-binding protein n=1 Tax=unclassified Campylobacter TaxID=2593542 RepID=UPI00115F5366|nr:MULTISPECIES: ABC transporter ATP-binding protein [unclassified Campylobacter]NDJ26422.1 ABC transporter ATP-binding protein [Campylobacter sp. MIT 19-121]TQR42997.1 nitrate ABC transporter ATP-binding protein [Campylobacter sp. MIT 12-8780]
MKIKLENISKFYGKNPILKDFNLELKNGEFVCILGKSGCGKSTLLDILSGFTCFDGGKALLENKVYEKSLPISKKRIKIFQDYALLEYKSVLENVKFALKAQNFNKKELEKRALQFISLVGLSEKKDEFVSKLSGGQKQRVALARALTCEPEILLLDEPFSALDNFTRKYLQKELLKLAKQSSSTMILVTHDIEEALFLGDRIIVLEKMGKILGDLKGIKNEQEKEGLSFYTLKNRIENLLLGKVSEDDYIAI